MKCAFICFQTTKIHELFFPRKCVPPLKFGLIREEQNNLDLESFGKMGDQVSVLMQGELFDAELWFPIQGAKLPYKNHENQKMISTYPCCDSPHKKSWSNGMDDRKNNWSVFMRLSTNWLRIQSDHFLNRPDCRKKIFSWQQSWISNSKNWIMSPIRFHNSRFSSEAIDL